MDIIIFLAALSVLVLVHELGHFLAARFNNIRVEEFGLGLPPRIGGKRIGETIWSLNWLPIGGFVRLFGEDHEEKGERAFNNKKPWQKLMVVIGGVTMNVVAAVVIFAIVYSVMGVPVETDKVKVVGIVPGGPAEVAGIKEGDVVQKVGDVEVKSARELIEEVGKYKGKKVTLEVAGAQGIAPVQVEVRENPPKGEGPTGVAVSNTEMEPVGWRIDKGIAAGFKEAFYWGKIIVGGVGSMIGGLLQGQVSKDIAGPIGMYQATTQIKNNQGLLALLHFFGIISVNLAVVNILPFPALDGGRLVFVLYEMLFRKKPNPKFEAAVNSIGMVVLLSLIAMVTIGDIVRTVWK